MSSKGRQRRREVLEKYRRVARETTQYKRVFVDGRWMLEHRLVMEKKLGRKLRRGEVVHHIDHDKANNHPDNLQLMEATAHDDHHRAHVPRHCSNCNTLVEHPKEEQKWWRNLPSGKRQLIVHCSKACRKAILKTIHGDAPWLEQL